LSGHYLSDRQFLLDNMTDGGSAGYQVLTPFVPEGSDTWVLVNRGWIPKKFGTTLLPDVEVSESDRRVAGRITRLPRPGLELAGDPQAGPEWPRVTQFPTIEELAEALGADLAQRMVLLEPSAADGFLRKWNPVEFGPERHLGYAFQWFALAATLLIIYVGLNLKRSGNGGR
jgi:surfeit locus 1 family protein